MNAIQRIILAILILTLPCTNHTKVRSKTAIAVGSIIAVPSAICMTVAASIAAYTFQAKKHSLEGFQGVIRSGSLKEYDRNLSVAYMILSGSAAACFLSALGTGLGGYLIHWGMKEQPEDAAAKVS